MRKETPKRVAAYRAVFFALGCALFIYLLARLDTAKILALLLEIGWNLGWIAAIYVVYELVRTAALWLCVTAHDRISYWDVVKIRATGEAVQFLTFMGPILAEPAKALLLHQRGIAWTHAFAALVAEYLIYTLTSAAMGLGALLYMLLHFDLAPAFAAGARIAACIAGAFLAAAAFAMPRRYCLIGAILNRMRAMPVVGRLQRIDPEGLRKAEDLWYVVLHDRPRRFLSVLGVEIAAQSLLVVELYVLLIAARQAFSSLDPLLIESSAKFLPMIAFPIPGQAGAAEGLYAAIFSAVGLPAAAGFSLALARRLRSLLVSGAGLAFVWFHKRRAAG